MILEAVLLHGPDRALEETIDMKTDIKALQSFTCSDFVEAGHVQQKATDIIELLEDGTKLQQRRGDVRLPPRPPPPPSRPRRLGSFSTPLPPCLT